MRAKRWELDMWLLYMAIGKHVWQVQWHHHTWPWVTLQGQIQGHSDFETLYLVKELGHMLPWNKPAENCHLSHQLQVSSRAPRCMELLFWKMVRTCIWETALSRVKFSPFSIPWGRKKVYMQLLDLLLVTKFPSQIWQFWKMVRSSETAACRAQSKLYFDPVG